MTVFGVAPPGGEMAEHAERFGALGRPRFFFGPGKRFGWGSWPLTKRVKEPGCEPVISVKTWNETDFAAMFATRPKDVDGWHFAYRHEPEDDIYRGELTIAEMVRVYARARTLIDGQLGSGCRLILILNWYQLARRDVHLDMFDSVAELVDTIGVDCYAPRDWLAQNVYATPGALFGPALDLAERHGLPWAVPEYGLAMAADGNKARHARMLLRHASWLHDHGTEWVSYWCNPAGDYGPHICTDLVYDEAFKIWRTLASA